jgi:hypothetical protein
MAANARACRPAKPSLLGELLLLPASALPCSLFRCYKTDTKGSINLEFNAQLQNRLSQLPTPSDPPTPEDIQRKEECMSTFYADWQAANREKQARWVRQWWGELWAGLRMQGRVYVARMMRR